MAKFGYRQLVEQIKKEPGAKDWNKRAVASALKGKRINEEQAKELELLIENPNSEKHNSLLEDLKKFIRKPKGKIVENKELGIRYSETIIKIPKYRQETYGITRIRRREVLEPYPKGFYRFETEKDAYNPKDSSGFYMNLENDTIKSIYSFLTDGLIPSKIAWYHVMTPWHEINDYKDESIILKFKKDNLFFQEIFYKESMNNDRNLRYLRWRKFERKNGTIQISDDDTINNGLGFRSFCCGTGNIWTNHLYIFNTPIFIFAGKNKSFRKYIDSIFSNKETIEMFERMESKHGKSKDNTDVLNLIDGRISENVKYSETKIPVFKHPEIKPLRWCHSDLAIIPTKESLNILFFETD